MYTSCRRVVICAALELCLLATVAGFDLAEPGLEEDTWKMMAEPVPDKNTTEAKTTSDSANQEEVSDSGTSRPSSTTKVSLHRTGNSNNFLAPFGAAVKSEPEPAPEYLYIGHVLTVVGTTFREQTQVADKDVVINLYAPWCGHCQRFKPVYRKLSRQLSHVETLVFAQMDATNNDLPEDLTARLEAYPTIRLFPAGNKGNVSQFQDKDGRRTVANLTAWIYRVATHGNFSHTPQLGAEDRVGSGLLSDAEEAEDEGTDL